MIRYLLTFCQLVGVSWGAVYLIQHIEKEEYVWAGVWAVLFLTNAIALAHRIAKATGVEIRLRPSDMKEWYCPSCQKKTWGYPPAILSKQARAVLDSIEAGGKHSGIGSYRPGKPRNRPGKPHARSKQHTARSRRPKQPKTRF